MNVSAPTITELMHKTVRQHLDTVLPDAVLNIETHMFNVTLTAASCAYDLDIGKELWLNRSRWSRLIKEYVPKEPLHRFIAQAKEIMAQDARLGATANMLFRDPDRYEKKHRWGGCLMGATFRGDNGKSGPATLTFYSRTTYMGYMALMDAAIASVIARHITRERIAFRWHISSMQLHCFKTLPYIYSKPDLLERLTAYAKRDDRQIPPTWWHMSRWYAKVLEHYKQFGNNMLQHEKYGPFKRIKRRWMEAMGYSKKNLPPSLFPKQLDFSKAV